MPFGRISLSISYSGSLNTKALGLDVLIFNGQLLDSYCAVSEMVALILEINILVITEKRKLTIQELL